MRNEKWYQRRLAKYFTEHFDQYEDTAKYWNDPDDNCWLFDIPELDQRIELVCKDNGVIEETRFDLPKK